MCSTPADPQGVLHLGLRHLRDDFLHQGLPQDRVLPQQAADLLFPALVPRVILALGLVSYIPSEESLLARNIMAAYCFGELFKHGHPDSYSPASAPAPPTG